MGDGGLVLPHPFCKLLVGNILLRRNEELGSKEERSKDISLHGIVSNAREQSELALLREAKGLSHPREVMTETEVTAQDTLGSALATRGEGQSGIAVRSNQDVRARSSLGADLSKDINTVDLASGEVTVVSDTERGDFSLELEVIVNVSSHKRSERAGLVGGLGNVDKGTRLCDFEIDLLSGRRVERV